MLKRLVLGVFGLVALLAAILLIRTMSLETNEIQVEPAPAWAVDLEGATARLAKGLTYQTISFGGKAALPTEEFLGLREHLTRSYPLTHSTLERELVSEYSLLYTWKGRDPSLDAALLMAHQDVVPVDEGKWTHPPFGGQIVDGVLWGRGAIDDKGALFAILEAVEGLLAEGFAPDRTILLFFGHDEELGGPDGAARAAQLLQSRGVSLAWVIDEGGFVAEGMVPGVESRLAMVGIAEKGSVTYRLRLETPGGHSSIPPRHSAIGIMAEAITRLEANPMPGGIDSLTERTLESMAPSLPFAIRLVLANLWLFGGAVEMAISSVPKLDATQRTTTAVTIMNSGIKSNVLPTKAEAVVNFRIRPGDTAQDVRNHIRRVIDDERIEILDPARSREASPVSDTHSEAFAYLSKTIAEIFPGTPVVPYVVMGGTDCRRFYSLTDNVYRFNPFPFGAGIGTLPHGTDERVGVAGLEDAVRFYARLISNSGS